MVKGPERGGPTSDRIPLTIVQPTRGHMLSFNDAATATPTLTLSGHDDNTQTLGLHIAHSDACNCHLPVALNEVACLRHGRSGNLASQNS